MFLSLTNSSAGSLDFSFVGLQNFANVVRSPVFQRSLQNTFIFTFVSQLTVIVLRQHPRPRPHEALPRAGRSCAS